MDDVERRIAEWCRSREGQRAVGGKIGMREVKGKMRVVDFDHSITRPVVAEGSTWAEVLAALEAKGYVVPELKAEE